LLGSNLSSSSDSEDDSSNDSFQPNVVVSIERNLPLQSVLNDVVNPDANDAFTFNLNDILQIPTTVSVIDSSSSVTVIELSTRSAVSVVVHLDIDFKSDLEEDKTRAILHYL